MPQVDVETLVCGSDGDGKASCESLVTATLTLPDTPLSSDPDPNLPPESIRIPIDSYLDLAVAVYDRDDSTKESTNPKSHTNQPNNPNPNNNNSRSNSQRYAAGSGSGSSTNIKANGPIFGLPNKIKHVTCSVSRPRAPSTNARIFPKNKPGANANNNNKSVPEVEPSSPKVSCIGKVLSDRERCHRRSPQPGCFASLFACGAGKTKNKKLPEPAADVAEGSVRSGRNIPPAEAAPAPALGGMNRFASGRRSASWGSDLDAGDVGHVAVDLARRSFDEVRAGGPAGRS